MMPAMTCEKAEEKRLGAITMSAMTQAKEAAAPFDDETPAVHVTRLFKVTEENKTETVRVSLNDEVSEYLMDLSLRSARWRSFGQLVNDSIIYYLNSDSQSGSVESIINEARWDSYNQKSAAITKTLFDEIDLLVKNGHTPWESKQSFYICALYCYIDAGFPVVVPR